MSFEAIRWALQQPIPNSPAKFVLVVLADKADADWHAWPTIASIAETTHQDRKTVLAALARLVALGYISDSGCRRGGTGQVVVYILNSTKNGTVEQAQKRNSTESGTVPYFPDNSTVFPAKESRFSLETVPNTGHGTYQEPIKEPITNQKQPRKRAEVVKVEVPDWIPVDAWQDWCEFRRGPKWTARAQQLSIRKLAEFREKGQSPLAIIERSIERGWTGLFELPPEETRNGTRQIGAAGRAEKLAREGDERDARREREQFGLGFDAPSGFA